MTRLPPPPASAAGSQLRARRQTARLMGVLCALMSSWVLSACGGAETSHAPTRRSAPAEAGFPRRLVVSLAVSDEVNAGTPLVLRPELGQWRLDSGDVARRRRLIQQQRSSWEQSLPAGVRVIRRFDNLPMAVVEVDSDDAVSLLQASPLIRRVEADERLTSTTTTQPRALVRTTDTTGPSSNQALIGQSAAESRGQTGDGATIVVIDSGIDHTLSEFGACQNPGDPAPCRVAAAVDLPVGTDDGQSDSDSFGRGSTIALAALESAPDARIIALDVTDAQGETSTAAVLAAYDWILDPANIDTYNISSAVLGIAVDEVQAYGDRTAGPCRADSDALVAAIGAARTAGILSVILAGDQNRTDGIVSPACADVAVAASGVNGACAGCNQDPADANVYLPPDALYRNSNNSALVTLLAPAQIPYGQSLPGHTGVAAGYIGGALATLRMALGSESPPDHLSRLVQTGTAVRDQRLTTLEKPRINIDQALCLPRLTPSTLPSIPREGTGTQPVAVQLTLAAGCPWTASSSAAWLVIPGDQRSGSGPVTLRLAASANGGGAREADVTVGGARVRLRQEGVVAAVVLNPLLSVYERYQRGLDANDKGFAQIRGRVRVTPNNASRVCLREGSAPTVDECNATPAGGDSVRTVSALPTWEVEQWVRVAPAEGRYTVHGLFFDAQGGITRSTANGPVEMRGTTEFIIDRTAPQQSGTETLQATLNTESDPPRPASVHLRWPAYEDPAIAADVPGSGLDRYVLYFALGIPANCGAGGGIPVTGTEYTHAGIKLAGGAIQYRLCAVDKAGNWSTGLLTSVDVPSSTDPVTGTITLQSAGVTRNRSATVQLRVPVTGTVQQACVGTLTGAQPGYDGIVDCGPGNNWFTWPAFDLAQNRGVTLNDRDGPHVIFARFKDAAGNISAPVSVPVILDRVPPVPPAVGGVMAQRNPTTASPDRVTIRWQPFVDATTRVTRHVVRQSSPIAPADCSSGTVVSTVGATAASLDLDLRPGVQVGWRVCAYDEAENVSGQSYDFPASNATPWGKLLINAGPQAVQGASHTNNRDIYVTLIPQPPSGVTITRVCVSTNGFCQNPVRLPSNNATIQQNVTLPAPGTRVWEGDGIKKVYAFWGDDRVFGPAAVGQIILDRTAPGSGRVQVEPQADGVKVSWWGFNEQSGGYRVVYGLPSAVSRCTGIDQSRVVFSGKPTPPAPIAGRPALQGQVVHKVTTAGRTLGYRVCAYDAAGNESEGTTTTFAPTGSLPRGDMAIDDGAPYTRDLDVELVVTPRSGKNLRKYCASARADECDGWTDLPTASPGTPVRYRIPFRLPDLGDGKRSVSVWLQDDKGENGPASVDDIVVDTLPPTDGDLTAASGPDAVALAWRGVTDDTSGVNSLVMMYTVGSTPPLAGCPNGVPVPIGAAGTFPDGAYLMQTALNGQFQFRLCARDRAGNLSDGVVASAELSDATGARIVLDDGATYARDASAQVLFLLPGGWQGTYCLSAGLNPPCDPTTTLPAGRRVPFTLVGGDGTRTVYARLRQTGFNDVMTLQDDIRLDKTRPKDTPPLTLVSDDRSITLWWSAADDGLEVAGASGVSRYIVSFAQGATAPARCDIGVPGTGYVGPLRGVANPLVHRYLTNSVVYSYRVCALDKAGNVSAGLTASAAPSPEGSAPQDPTITIAEGRAAITPGPVSVALSAFDPSEPLQYCIRQSPGQCSSGDWKTLAATVTGVRLAAGDGARALYAYFRDSLGNNTLQPAMDDIIVDSSAPIGGVATTRPGQLAVQVRWSGFADPESGVEKYLVTAATGATPPPAKCTGTPLYAGPLTSLVDPNIALGVNRTYRVCAVNRAGLVSDGVTVAGVSVPEAYPPTGTVRVVDVAGVDQDITSGTVTLELSASDPNAAGAQDDGAVTHYCVMNREGVCPVGSWRAYAPAAGQTFVRLSGWSFGNSDGERTVYAYFRDRAGNESEIPATDTITLDVNPPRDGRVLPTQGDRRISLTMTGYADPNGQIARYVVVYAPGRTAPATCDPAQNRTGQTFVLGSFDTPRATHATHTPPGGTAEPLVNGTYYAYRVCAVDRAGNMSRGAIRVARPVPETNPPTVPLVVAAPDAAGNGLSFTSGPKIRVRITGADESALASLCVRVVRPSIIIPPACDIDDPWLSWTTDARAVSANGLTREVDVVAPAGAIAVYVWLRDAWDNVTRATEPGRDDTYLDIVPPTEAVFTRASAFTPAEQADQPGQLGVRFEWRVSNDGTGSGVRGYLLARKANPIGADPPDRCAAGPDVTVFNLGMATELPPDSRGRARLGYSDTQGIQTGVTYGYRLCAVDQLGQVSSGVRRLIVGGQPPDTERPTLEPPRIAPSIPTATVNGKTYTSNNLIPIQLRAAEDGQPGATWLADYHLQVLQVNAAGNMTCVRGDRVLDGTLTAPPACPVCTPGPDDDGSPCRDWTGIDGRNKTATLVSNISVRVPSVGTMNEYLVRAYVRDIAGNMSLGAESRIVVDRNSPTDGQGVVQVGWTKGTAAGQGIFTLEWPVATDAAGLKHYIVARAPLSRLPATQAAWDQFLPRCNLTGAQGVMVTTNRATIPVTNISSRLLQVFRVCAVDQAGPSFNVSKGLVSTPRQYQ